MNEFAMPLPLFFAAEKTALFGAGREETGIRFNTLFSAEKKALYNFILKSVNFSEDADDIYQNTTLRALKYFKKFDRTRKFKPWIFTIASNELKTYFRSQSFLRNIMSTEVLNEQIPDKKDRELSEAVFSTAWSLKPMEREIFFLFYDSGFSIIEISEITDKRAGNIKVILSNARKKIRELLGSSQ